MSNILLFVIPIMEQMDVPLTDKNVRVYCNIEKIKGCVKNLPETFPSPIMSGIQKYIECCQADASENTFSGTIAIEQFKKIPKGGQVEDLLIGVLVESLKDGDDDITEDSFNIERIERYENKHIAKYMAYLKTFYPIPEMWGGAHKYLTKLALDCWEN